MALFARSKLSRVILISGFIPTILLISLSILSVVVIRDLEATRKWVEHTEKVLAHAYQIDKTVAEIQVNQRGYFLTHDFKYLIQARNIKDQALSEIRNLKVVIKDNTPQVKRLDDYMAIFNLWYTQADTLAEEINSKYQRNKTRDYDRIIEVITSETRQELRTKMYTTLRDFIDRENDLLISRRISAEEKSDFANNTLITGTLLLILLFIITAFLTAKKISIPINTALKAAEQVAIYDFTSFPTFGGFLEAENLYTALDKMRLSLQKETLSLKEQQWLKSNLANLLEELTEIKSSREICERYLKLLTPLVGGLMSSIYLKSKNDFLLMHSYGADNLVAIPKNFKLGEGLVGQVAKDKSILKLDKIPEQYFRIHSSLGAVLPNHLVICPVIFENNCVAVFEIGKLHAFSALELEFFTQISKSFGIILTNLEAQELTKELLVQSEILNSRLKSQQDELQSFNEELQQKQEEIEAQSEELVRNNEELQEQSSALEQEKLRLDSLNQELELAKKEAEQSSQYKSEFLANMSHELRTPLNSIMILSQLMAMNDDKNLTENQIRNALTIHTSGDDLLRLINDILDLSKIEAGKLDVHFSNFQIIELIESLKRTFDPLMMDKKIQFEIIKDDSLPEMMTSDKNRIEQIIKNLLSNAHKFTEKGKITTYFKYDPHQAHFINIVVEDSGIGIPLDKQQEVFEAFRQIDSSVSRKYQGTGLGLSISKSLAEKLGGDIFLESALGSGSKFTLILPLSPQEKLAPQSESTYRTLSNPLVVETPFKRKNQLKDDRDNLRTNDKIVLVIEDDPRFAQILIDQARENHFKCVYAENGEIGLSDALNLNPNGIILDIRLPGVSGLIVLDRLKNSPKTKNIPIYVISSDDFGDESTKLGAINFKRKPVTLGEIKELFQNFDSQMGKQDKHILLVEDNMIERDALKQFIKKEYIKVETVGSSKEASDLIAKNSYDCIIVDLVLKEGSGFDVIERIRKDVSALNTPIIVYTGKDLSHAEIEQLEKGANSIIIKGSQSAERLLNEVTLFLYRIDKGTTNKAEPASLPNPTHFLRNKKLLIAEDDPRNVYVLRQILENKGATLITAENGREAINTLTSRNDIDLILMDVMMPEMNGLDAIKEIRKMEKFKSLPIISLTAKAMSKDRDECIMAGANDYIAKPFDPEQLLTLIKVWLS